MHQLEVTIKQGTLRGSTSTDFRGDIYYRFQGIPYAKPPTGNLRFKAPQPPEKWSGIFDATREGDSCYCRDLIDMGKISGSENCLVLNVYTTGLKGVERPVMVWIHGGVFYFGSSSTEFYGPDYLITQDVVIVTVNYRLGLWGFLKLKDPALGVPGNAGIKDMIMALKWVKNNIHSFGGNPNNVTIFGESAGAAAVHLLMLSPMAKDLFHKVIAQSGSVLHPWVLGDDTIDKVAEALDLDSKDEQIIYKHLIEAPAEKIFEIHDKLSSLYTYRPKSKRLFPIVIETDVKEPAVIEKDPFDIILAGEFNHVPLMIGFTSREGMGVQHFNTQEVQNFEEFIPWQLGYQQSAETKLLGDKIKHFYFGNEQFSSTAQDKLYQLLGDSFFIYPICLVVLNQFWRSKAPTYLYRMSVETELNLFKKMLGISSPGASHCDDLGHLFKNKFSPPITPKSKEEIALLRFVKLWTNFAKYGNPTPAEDSFLDVVWQPVSDRNLNFLDIGDQLVAMTDPEPDKLEFWGKIYAESPLGIEKQLSI